MKAVAIAKYGGDDVVEVRDMPTPQIKGNEVLVEVYSSCINPLDNKVKDGSMKSLLNYEFPLVLGTDFAGKVIQVGTQVSRFKAGDEVYGSLDARRMGAFSEYVAVADKYLSLKPRNLDFNQAASLPLVALTVIQVFTDIAKVTAGQKVFIKAGSGGIGSFAIQYAKALGAEVATTTSAENSDLVKRLGADHIIDYRTQKFEEMLSNYDVVLNTVDGEPLEASFSILKEGGPPDFSCWPTGQKICSECWIEFRLSIDLRFSRKKSDQPR